MNKHLRIISAILILFVLLLPSGCKKKKTSNQPKKKPTTSQKIALPKELTKIDSDIETIIKEGKKIQNTQSQSNNKTTVTFAPPSNNGKSSNPSGGGGEKQSKSTKPKPTVSPEKKSWDTIDKSIKDIHTNWNVLTPIVSKAGASSNLIDNVSTAINQLTTVSSSKSIDDTLIAANNVYKYIPDLEKNFNVKTPPDIKKLRYFNRDIEFNTMKNNWSNVTNDLSQLNTTWRTVKMKLPKEAKTNEDKFDAGLTELDKVVKAKDANLVKIKSNVLESDIISLEKSLKAKK